VELIGIWFFVRPLVLGAARVRPRPNDTSATDRSFASAIGTQRPTNLQRLLDAQGDGKLLQRLVHVLERLAVQPWSSLLPQSLSCAELCIRNALLITSPPNSHAQKLRRGFNLIHGGFAMAVVIVVGLLQGGVSLDQQARSR
jgi:hypothetical protein